MSSIIIESGEKKTNPFLRIFSHLGTIYILILGLSLGIVYYQGVYQNNYLYIYVPFIYIWPLALIAVGLSIFRVKSLVSLIVGLFLLVSAITITSFSVPIRKDTIESNTQTVSGSINDVKSIYTDMAFTAADLSIKGGGYGIDGEYTSNYGILTNTLSLDQDFVQNIGLKQLDIQPGFGSYSKKINLILSDNIPTIFDITANISSLSLDLEQVLLKSASITLRGSEASISLKQVDTTATLNISSTASRVTITIPRNSKVLLSTSHSFTQNDFIGLVQKGENSTLYESSNYQVSGDEKEKIVKVNLNSTFSQIKVIQE
jgi:hypothetical protein